MEKRKVAVVTLGDSRREFYKKRESIVLSEIEKVKKDNDVQSYKEIVAFSEGKLLDDIQKQCEIGKRPYQKNLLVIGSMLITLAVCVLIGFLMHVFLN